MRIAGVFLAVLAAAGLAAGSGPVTAPDLIVHEWGTFLAVQGSDGLTMDGMYHEEHALPAFVHSRSRDQLRIPHALVKGETPVIYFHTSRRQRVEVSVAFPTGIWTQWYPQAGFVGPRFSQAESPPRLRDGSITWNVELVPRAQEAALPAPPRTGPGSLWEHSRQVNAALVRYHRERPAVTETERFLFYRGLGSAPLPVTLSAPGGGTLSLEAGEAPVRTVLVIRVEEGRAAWKEFPILEAGRPLTGVVPDLSRGLPLAQAERALSERLEHGLQEAGLFPDEARAMVNTWRASYFDTDGIRALFILPQGWTDRAIPLRMEPRPAKLVRVMVGRLEMLHPERERKAREALSRLAGGSAAERAAAFEFLRKQGRFVEPLLRRTLARETDPGLRRAAERLLLADFVADLQTALAQAGPDRELADRPVNARAQLALLLRQIGEEEGARREGEAVLAQLAREAPPKMDSHVARHPLRAAARAAEATGDLPRALAAYEQYLRFGSQVVTRRDCLNCHDFAGGPARVEWLQDWWAGRRYAELAGRAGAADRLLSSEGDGSAFDRMRLAYLHAAAGNRAEASRLWAGLGAARGKVAAGRD